MPTDLFDSFKPFGDDDAVQFGSPMSGFYGGRRNEDNSPFQRIVGDRPSLHHAYISRSPARRTSREDNDRVGGTAGGDGTGRSWRDVDNRATRPASPYRPVLAKTETRHGRPRPDFETDSDNSLLKRLEGLKIDDGTAVEDESRTDPAAGGQLVSRGRSPRPSRKGVGTSPNADTDDENPFFLYPEIDHVGRLPSPAIAQLGRRGRPPAGADGRDDNPRGDDEPFARPALPEDHGTLPTDPRKNSQRRESSARSTTDRSEGTDGRASDTSTFPATGSCVPPTLKTRKRGRCQSSAASLFVCPYVRYDPDKYEKWSSCRRGAWSTTHRVKEHLYRVHQGKPFCPRCGQTFEAEDEVRSHLSRPEGVCERVDGFEVEGFDAAQEKKLHSRKRKRTTELENWKDIFRILFPGETSIPDPYYRSAHSKHDGPASMEASDAESVYARESSQQMEAALARVQEIIRKPLDKKQRVEMLAVLGELGGKRSTHLDDGDVVTGAYSVQPMPDEEWEPRYGSSSSPEPPPSSSSDFPALRTAGDGHVPPLDDTGPCSSFRLDSMATSADFWPLEDSYLETFDADAFIQQYQNPYPEYCQYSWRVGDVLDDDTGRA